MASPENRRALIFVSDPEPVKTPPAPAAPAPAFDRPEGVGYRGPMIERGDGEAARARIGVAPPDPRPRTARDRRGASLDRAEGARAKPPARAVAEVSRS
jgi:hypothetical protein